MQVQRYTPEQLAQIRNMIRHPCTVEWDDLAIEFCCEEILSKCLGESGVCLLPTYLWQLHEWNTTHPPSLERFCALTHGRLTPAMFPLDFQGGRFSAFATVVHGRCEYSQVDHWSLLVIQQARDGTGYTALMFDSLGSSRNRLACERILDQLSMIQFFRGDPSYEIINVSVPLQDEDLSCGIRTCAALRNYTRRRGSSGEISESSLCEDVIAIKTRAGQLLPTL